MQLKQDPTLLLPPHNSPSMNDPAYQHILAVCQAASQGDLEARVTGLYDDPVWGPLARAINQQLDTVDSFVRESHAAMSCCSHGEFHRPILLRGMPGAFRAAALIINKAGLQMRKNAEDLALVAKMAADNAVSASGVAAASEELNVTTSEISKQTQSTKQWASEAARLSEQAEEALNGLVRAFSEIENLRNSIRSIADRTNLLAFNASIEASRAGEAGVRFAVVAQEVKKLSSHTSQATDNIRSQVETMRRALEESTHIIHTLGDELRQLQQASTQIANILQEQTAATSEISARMAEISANTAKVSQRIKTPQ